VKPKIVVSLLSQDHEFQQLQAAEAERAASRAGVTVETLYARNNPRLQIEQLYRFIHAPENARPAAIIVHPVSDDGLAAVAREAAKAGIGWIVLGRDVSYVDALRTEFPKVPIAIVHTNQKEIGRIHGRQITSLLPKGGNVLYIEGPPETSAAQQRLAGTQEVLQDSAVKLTILKGNWTESSGEEAVASWLRLSSSQTAQVHLVCAQNDAMAIGARKAILGKRAEWASIPFIGCDGVPTGGRKLVDEHQLAATVVVEPNTPNAINLVVTQNAVPASGRVTLQPSAYPG
jgi:ABC-type sugar transport system substrate-binding protein